MQPGKVSRYETSLICTAHWYLEHKEAEYGAVHLVSEQTGYACREPGRDNQQNSKLDCQ